MDNIAHTKKPIYPQRILQFGGGNFLRGFADWMIDILNEETEFKGNVIVVKPTKKGDYDQLKKQNGQYHVITRGVKEGVTISESRLIKCISKVVGP